MACGRSQYIIGSIVAVLIAVAAGYYSLATPSPIPEEPTFVLHLNDTVLHLLLLSDIRLIKNSVQKQTTITEQQMYFLFIIGLNKR